MVYGQTNDSGQRPHSSNIEKQQSFPPAKKPHMANVKFSNSQIGPSETHGWQPIKVCLKIKTSIFRLEKKKLLGNLYR